MFLGYFGLINNIKILTIVLYFKANINRLVWKDDIYVFIILKKINIK